jgi:GH15 family glucan-1,4-alpha-glucosidase
MDLPCPRARALLSLRMPSHVVGLAKIALAAALLSTSSPNISAGQTPGTTQGSQPSSASVRALLMNNWTDSLAIHYARQLYPKDSHVFGPYLVSLRSAADWSVNQIDGATAFFHAEVLGGNGSGTAQPNGPEQPASLCESSGDVKGDDLPADPGARQSYPSVMCFDDGGVLNVEYLRETERGLPIQIEKSCAMVPGQRFLVVRYTLTNNTLPQDNKTVRARFSEVVHLHNKGIPDHEKAIENMTDTGIYEPQQGQPVNDMHLQWHPEVNAWIADMSASNGTFLVFGAFQDMNRHRAFQPVSGETQFDRAVAPEMDNVDQPGPPQNVEQMTGKDLALALWTQVDLAPSAKQQYAFFYAVTSTLQDALLVAITARSPTNPNPGEPAGSWFDNTRQAYQSWLKQGRQFSTADPGLDKALTRALIVDKQSQQPAFGSFVAATNPAYGHKVWPRDSAVTALSLAAVGHLDEAVKFYRWMASVQEDGSKQDYPISGGTMSYPPGTWFSNYSYWLRKGPKSFREPEWDSLGLFMIGVYHTWRLLKDRDPQAADEFLNSALDRIDQGPTSVYDAVQRTAEYVRNNINDKGYGPGDFSIWEEDFEWATFTQASFASGLNAAHLLAEQRGDTDHANQWLASGRRVLDTLHRAASAQPCPGLWNDGESRWNRATWINCTGDDRLDASTDIVWVFGLVDASDSRADMQRNVVLSRLAPGNDHIGIGRYEGDEFYHQKDYSPGGQFEASTSMPSWPQMDMYVAMLEHWRGLDDIALKRLQWYARATNAGYVPPGEAVDRSTSRPLASTSAEPVTAGWYILGLLNYLNQFDPRLPSMMGSPAPQPTPSAQPSSPHAPPPSARPAR